MTDQAPDHVDPHPSGLPLAHWLSVTEGLIAARVARCLEEHGLTRAQWQVLSVLATAPHSPAELAAGFEEEQRASLPGQLEELRESGWVLAEGDLLALTATGREARGRVAAAVADLRSHATEGLPEEDFAVTVRTLRRIAANLGHPGA